MSGPRFFLGRKRLANTLIFFKHAVREEKKIEDISGDERRR